MHVGNVAAALSKPSLCATASESCSLQCLHNPRLNLHTTLEHYPIADNSNLPNHMHWLGNGLSCCLGHWCQQAIRTTWPNKSNAPLIGFKHVSHA